MTSETTYPDCAWRQKWFAGVSLGKDENPQLLNKSMLATLVEAPVPPMHYCGCGSKGESERTTDLVQLQGQQFQA